MTNDVTIPCSECGELVKVTKAYFTGVDGRALPSPECHCVECHERAVLRATRIEMQKAYLARPERK